MLKWYLMDGFMGLAYKRVLKTRKLQKGTEDTEIRRKLKDSIVS